MASTGRPRETEASIEAANEAEHAKLVAANIEFLRRLAAERRPAMCDYSISAASQRPAKVGDKLVSTQFGVTRGFAAAGEPSDQAICLLPGTELAFDEDIQYALHWDSQRTALRGQRVARFVQRDTDNAYTHHDALMLPDGATVLLHHLVPGTQAVVLQLPAQPKTAEEAAAQERVEQVA